MALPLAAANNVKEDYLRADNGAKTGLTGKMPFTSILILGLNIRDKQKTRIAGVEDDNAIGETEVEGLTQDQIGKEARELYRAEKEKSVLRPFTQRYPDLGADEAYRIQLALIELKKADGAKVVGKKIGLTSKAMQKMLNVDQPDYGHILDTMVLQDGALVRVSELIQPKIEPEIAFVLDRDLKGPGITPIKVLAATRFVVPALEIIDSRIEGWKIKLCDTIADNASSARVVLGNSPRRVDERDLKLVGMVLEKNGDIVQTGAGGAVLGHPAVAVAWLANAVGQFGVGLSAGDVIMPGALCGAADVAAGDLYQATYDGLGSVSARFV